MLRKLLVLLLLGAASPAWGAVGVPAADPRLSSVVSKTANYTVTAADYCVKVAPASGDVTLTLPAAATVPGFEFVLKKTSATYNVILDPNSSETIGDDAASTLTLMFRGEAAVIKSNGTSWDLRGRSWQKPDGRTAITLAVPLTIYGDGKGLRDADVDLLAGFSGEAAVIIAPDPASYAGQSTAQRKADRPQDNFLQNVTITGRSAVTCKGLVVRHTASTDLAGVTIRSCTSNGAHYDDVWNMKQTGCNFQHNGKATGADNVLVNSAYAITVDNTDGNQGTNIIESANCIFEGGIRQFAARMVDPSSGGETAGGDGVIESARSLKWAGCQFHGLTDSDAEKANEKALVYLDGVAGPMVFAGCTGTHGNEATPSPLDPARVVVTGFTLAGGAEYLCQVVRGITFADSSSENSGTKWSIDVAHAEATVDGFVPGTEVLGDHAYNGTSRTEWAKFLWNSNAFEIGTEKTGAGTNRQLKLQTNGTTRMVFAASTEMVGIGGLTSSHPGLKHSGAELQVRIADDSGFAPLSVGSLTLATPLAVASGGTGSATLSANVQTILGAADYAAIRTALSLAPGTHVQAYDADLDDLADGTLTGTKVGAATTSASGGSELATSAEVTTGSDTVRTITPDALRGSDAGIRQAQMPVVSSTTTLTTGDGKGGLWFRVPVELNGWNLVGVSLSLFDDSSSGLPTFQVRRVRAGTPADMLSTKVSVDATEFDSKDATTAAVIDAANDDVATGDQIYADCDIAGTGTLGANLTLKFQKP